MGGGHPHHIAGAVNTGRQMRRAGTVIDATVSIVTEDGHALRRLTHVRVAALILDLQSIQVLPNSSSAIRAGSIDIMIAAPSCPLLRTA